MFQRIPLAVLLSLAFSLPAAAQEAGAYPPDPVLHTAQAALLVLGMAFAAYWAYEAFNAPPFKLGDGPALPRYMTQPGQYRLGAIAFVAMCLVVYSLIAYFHQDLLPLVGIIAPDLYAAIEKSTKDGSLAYPLVVIFAAAIFIALLKIEKDWNPLLMLRRVVQGWVSIPQLANELMIMARDELVVPADWRAMVAANPDTPYVTIDDFDKDRRSLDRRWAELCYIRLWLELHRAQGSHFTFFNEPSFAWVQLQADYDDARTRIGPLKRGRVRGSNISNISNIFAEIMAKVDTLRRQYCRLAACFLVFKNQTQKNALCDAKQFGVTVAMEGGRANPLRYIAIYLVAIMVAIYLGVSLSAVGWDLLSGRADAAFSQDPDLITRWIGFALANYGMPILAILLLRYLGWTVDPSQPNSYLVSYAAIFLVALVVSAHCLALAIKLAGVGPAAALPYYEIVFSRAKWSVSPAIVAVYVAVHMDRKIDPHAPGSASPEQHGLLQRLTSCALFGGLVTLFSVVPTLAIPAVDPSAWTLNKLRMVVIGTTFIIGLTMALVGEFGLVRSEPTSQPDR
jgi:hypothetical protein